MVEAVTCGLTFLPSFFHVSMVALSGGAMNHWTSQVVAMSLKTGAMQKHLQYIIEDLTVNIKITLKYCDIKMVNKIIKAFSGQFIGVNIVYISGQKECSLSTSEGKVTCWLHFISPEVICCNQHISKSRIESCLVFRCIRKTYT